MRNETTYNHGWRHAILYSWVFHSFQKKPQSYEVQLNLVLFNFIANKLRL